MKIRTLYYAIVALFLVYVGVGVATGLVISSLHGSWYGALAGLGWPIWLLVGLVT